MDDAMLSLHCVNIGINNLTSGQVIHLAFEGILQMKTDGNEIMDQKVSFCEKVWWLLHWLNQ